MSKARIGVIGTGWWATDTHIPALLAHPDAELVALCDSDADRLASAAQRYGIAKTYVDVQAMLAQAVLDGVVIVSSNASHFTVAQGCLAAGVHVMLEKPMTLVAPDAQALVELSSSTGRTLIIGYPFNYAPYATRARAVIASGELGAVQYVNLVFSSYMTPLFTGQFVRNFNVHGPKQYTDPVALGGGHGQVQLTHGAGLLFFVTGLRPARVSALMSNHSLPVDLIDVMTVQFAGGAVGTAGGSGNQMGGTFRLQVSCEHGWLEIDAQRGVGSIHRNGQPVEEISYREQEEPAPLSHRTAHNLVDAVLGRQPNGSPPEIGWRAVELLDAAYRSAARDGEFVAVQDLYGR